jgi:hypothetical protein
MNKERQEAQTRFRGRWVNKSAGNVRMIEITPTLPLFREELRVGRHCRGLRTRVVGWCSAQRPRWASAHGADQVSVIISDERAFLERPTPIRMAVGSTFLGGEATEVHSNSATFHSALCQAIRRSESACRQMSQNLHVKERPGGARSRGQAPDALANWLHLLADLIV